jgi:ABC-2 type transport system ATP-binding protein
MLVLDEPTTGVDPVSRREFWKLLAEFLAQGLTILVATPYLDEAERCARVALVSNGRLLALDAPGVLQRAMSGVMVEVVGSPVRLALQTLRATLGAERAQLFGDRVHVHLDRAHDADALVQQLERAGVQQPQARTILPTLEDVFIERLQHLPQGKDS